MGNRNRFRSSKFFQNQLLRCKPEDVGGLIARMESESQGLMKKIHTILWHMRGGLTREDAWAMSPKELNLIVEDINTRIKTAKETGVPLI